MAFLCAIALPNLFMKKLHCMNDQDTRSDTHANASRKLTKHLAFFMLPYRGQPFYKQEYCDAKCEDIDTDRIKIAAGRNLLIGVRLNDETHISAPQA